MVERVQSNLRIFVLEGLPGAGKTSILKNLSQEVFIIDEILNPMIVSEVSYLENDFRKLDRAKQSGGVALIDRCYPATLAHNYARFYLDGSSDYYELLSKLCQYKLSGAVAPDAYIYIQINPETSLRRKGRPFNPNNIWTSPEHLRIMSKYYEYYFKLIEPNIPCFIVNGNLSELEIINKVKSLILA